MRITRFLSLIVLFCVLFVPVSFADADEYENDLSKLHSLGILDVDLNLLKTSLTRGEFSLWLATLIKQNNASYTGEAFFSDVRDDSPYFSSVYSLYNAGVVSSGNMFRPEDTLKHEEAVKMLVTLLGYAVYAEARGGYPTGYFSVLQTKDINISQNALYADGSLTREQGIYLITKAVEIPILSPIGFGEQITYESQHDVTILSVYHDIYKTRGVVETIGTRSLRANGGLSPNRIKLNDTIFENSCKADVSCIGARVTGYYKNHEDDIPSLLYVKKDATTQLSVNHDDIINFESGVITYKTANGSTKTAAIPVDANLLYNYSFASTYDKNDILNASRIEFISMDGSGNYDIVNIINAETIVVSGIHDDKIYGKNGEVVELTTISNENYFKFYDKNGQPSFLSNIGEWTVLSVIRDKENVFSEIYISNETVVGVIDEISSDAGKTIYIVNGGEYKLSKDTKQPPVMVAQNVIIYLNIYGEIGWMAAQKGDGNLKCGYLAAVDISNKLNGMHSVMIFTEEAKLTKFFLAENFRITNAGKLTGEAILDQIKLNNHKAVRQLINYLVDQDGNIKEITLAERITNEEDLLNEKPHLTRYNDLISDEGDATWDGKITYPYNKEFLSFYGNMRINSNTLVMFVPSSEKYYDDETRYSIVKPNLLASDTYTYVEVYNLSPDRTAGVIVIRQDEGGGIRIKRNTAVTLVTKIAQVTDDKGERRTKIYGFRNNLNCEFLLADGVSLTQYYLGENKEKLASTVEVGDLIRTGTNSDGEIVDYYKVFSARNRDNARYVKRGNEYENKKTNYLGSPHATMLQYAGNAPRLTDDFSVFSDVTVGRVYHGKDEYWYPLYPFSLEFGIAKERYNNEVVVTNISAGTNLNSPQYTTHQRYMNMNNRPVYIFDEEKGTLVKGSLDDLVVSDNAGVGNASRIVYARYEDVPSFILIVRRKG